MGFWASTFWAAGFWATGFWNEPASGGRAGAVTMLLPGNAVLSRLLQRGG